MQRLRHLTHLSRLVLAWFVLSIGVAVASPLVAPKDVLLICTGSGAMKVLVKSDDGSTHELTKTMDCPLCAMVAPPPSLVQVALAPVSPLAFVLQGIPSAHVAARTAAPLPPRGPPHAT